MRYKKRYVTCTACDRPLNVGQKVCDCGAATRFMDFEERTRYEVEQWRSHRQSAVAQAV